MKNLLILFFTCVFSSFSFAQSDTINNASIAEVPEIYYRVDKMPVWRGCEYNINEQLKNECTYDNIREFLSLNVKYPEEAKKEKITGTVYMQFIVDKEGNTTDINILKSASPELDEEALRVVQLLPQWIPGVLNGETVNVQYILPIKFSL